MTSSRRLWRLWSLASFLMGILHVFLFPLVNISSGELKPRGLFIDENAFTMNSKSLRRSIAFPSVNEIEATFDVSTNQRFRTILSLKKALIPITGTCEVFKQSLMGCTLQSLHKSRSQEATVLVFPVYYRDIVFTSVDDMLQREVIDSLSLTFAFSLACSLRMASWASRNFLLIFLPMSAPLSSSGYNQRFSRSLNQYLDLYHRHNANLHEPIESVGLLRDSFVLDFHPVGGVSNDIMHPSIGELLSNSISLSSVELRIVGSNGVLSNMDFITAPLVTYYSRFFETEANYFVSKFHHYVDKILAVHPRSLLNTIHKNLYLERLIGLISFGFAQICGPSGLHGQFLDKDIESLTMHIKRSDGLQNFPDELSQTEMPIMYIANTLHDVLQAHSTLHEELHHSMFFYMLMNNKDFVGVSEYGFSLLLILFSLFLIANAQLIEIHTEKRKNDNLTKEDNVSNLISYMDKLSFEKKPESAQIASINSSHQDEIQDRRMSIGMDIQIALETLLYDLLPTLMISLLFSARSFSMVSTALPLNKVKNSYETTQHFFHDVIIFLRLLLKNQVDEIKGFFTGFVVNKDTLKSHDVIEIEYADSLIYTIEVTGMSLIALLLTTNAIHCFLIDKRKENKLSISCYISVYMLYVLTLLTWVGCQNYALAIFVAVPILVVAYIVEEGVSTESISESTGPNSNGSNLNLQLNLAGVLVNPYFCILVLLGAYALKVESIVLYLIKVFLGPSIEKCLKGVNSSDNFSSLCLIVVIFVPYSVCILMKRVIVSRRDSC